MIVEKSYTRITLALDIIQKLRNGAYRGYHELNIIKHQIDLYDIITIRPSKKMTISCNMFGVPVDDTNLCWQAAEALKNKLDIQENIHINIEKNIPVKGGLAGGSANAALILSMLNTLWELKLGNSQLSEIGRIIGMDVPFYFTGGTAFDTETTGVLEPVPTDLQFDFVLVIPDFGISTRAAYANIDYTAIAQNIKKTTLMKDAFNKNDRQSVISLMHNDFEESVFKQYPMLRQIREEMIRAGCLNAVLTGSGSTLIGIAESKEHAQWIKKHIQGECLVMSTYKA